MSRNPLGYANALIRGLISLWIVGASMTSEGARSLLTIYALPPQAFAAIGILGMLWIIPGFWCIVFGILGVPSSWPDLLKNAWNMFQSGPLQGFPGALLTLYKTLVFLPFTCPTFLDELPEPLKLLLFRQRPEIYPPPKDQVDAPVQDEYWIFINGVATTTQAGESSVHFLYKLFHRPIHFCYNPTDGILVDLIECAVGKIGFFQDLWVPEPRKKLAHAVMDALNKAESGTYKRVVIVAHSQGTIITSNAIEKMGLNSRYRRLMKKHLEVFAFANCAHQMDDSNLVSLENISNQRDTVAFLGALFPFASFWQDGAGRGIQIDGTFVTEPNLWGHLLNTHYLEPFQKGKYPTSRLHMFRNGRNTSASNVTAVARK